MSPLLKYLIRKRSKAKSRGKLSIAAELTGRKSGIISHYRTKMAKSECTGTSQWRKNVDFLSHRRNRAHLILDNEFKENLNDYFGELCWDRNYEQPTLMEIDSITIKAPQFSITQVKNALLKIRKTATGPDEIPFWVWKENADVFAPVVTKIWNESLSTSTWPTSWKIAHIDPLPKVENPKEYCESRGINVTPRGGVVTIPQCIASH
jgi:hypothetical protein